MLSAFWSSLFFNILVFVFFFSPVGFFLPLLLLLLVVVVVVVVLLLLLLMFAPGFWLLLFASAVASICGPERRSFMNGLIIAVMRPAILPPFLFSSFYPPLPPLPSSSFYPLRDYPTPPRIPPFLAAFKG